MIKALLLVLQPWQGGAGEREDWGLQVASSPDQPTKGTHREAAPPWLRWRGGSEIPRKRSGVEARSVNTILLLTYMLIYV